MRRPMCAVIVAAAICFLCAASATHAFMPSDIPGGTTPPDGAGSTGTVGGGGTTPTFDAPEPASVALGLIGSGALGLYLRRRCSA